jgi:ApaG protein
MVSASRKIRTRWVGSIGYGGGIHYRIGIVPAAVQFTPSPSRLSRQIAGPSLVSAADFVCNVGMADSKRYEITVTTKTQFVPDQSDEANGRYVFAYTITILNTGSVPAQLISRHWVIADATGEMQEVRGLGVVGAQPLLKPGEKFEYTSGTAIATAVGTMRGSYQMVAEDGTPFEASIPEFTLAAPRVLH